MSDNEASGDVVTTEEPADAAYDSRTTAILLVVAFLVAAAGVYLCFAVARRRRAGGRRASGDQHTMRLDILNEEFRVPDGDNPYLSLQLDGSQKDTRA